MDNVLEFKYYRRIKKYLYNLIIYNGINLYDRMIDNLIKIIINLLSQIKIMNIIIKKNSLAHII